VYSLLNRISWDEDQDITYPFCFRREERYQAQQFQPGSRDFAVRELLHKSPSPAIKTGQVFDGSRASTPDQVGISFAITLPDSSVPRISYNNDLYPDH